MARILHLFAHPHPRESRANAALWHAANGVEGITSVDLYARYPRFDIDVAGEQAALLAHDLLVLQFPIYWYAAPALLKEWCDAVLLSGWAYGPGGEALRGKALMLAVTTGSPAQAYAPDGFQAHPLTTYLTPYRQLSVLCGMDWVPPYVLHGAGRADPTAHARGFARLLQDLRDDKIDVAGLSGRDALDADAVATLGDPR